MIGTKWCGVGNQSKSFNDLGFFQSTDKCCREHDTCEDYIDVGMSKYGLLNDGGFTWSRCDCDVNLLKCLKSAKTPLSKYIGYLYFTILGPKCFKLSFPIDKCVEYHYYEHLFSGYVLCVFSFRVSNFLILFLEQSVGVLNTSIKQTRKNCFSCLTIQFFENYYSIQII